MPLEFSAGMHHPNFTYVDTRKSRRERGHLIVIINGCAGICCGGLRSCWGADWSGFRLAAAEVHALLHLLPRVCVSVVVAVLQQQAAPICEVVKLLSAVTSRDQSFDTLGASRLDVSNTEDH